MGWKRVPGEALLFESGDAQLSIWVMPALVPVDELVHVATQLAAIRQETERESLSGVQLTPPQTRRVAEGLAETVYAGTHAGSAFCFLGLVTPRKALSLWVSTRDTRVVAGLFTELRRSLALIVP